jgi:hypothetical protein
MRTITLLAALALVLNIAVGIYVFLSAVSSYKGGLAPWMLDQLTWIIAEGFMAAFFFSLYARQKN